MKFSGGRLLGVALVFVFTTFPAEARKLDSGHVKKPASVEMEAVVPPKDLNYGMLPKGPVPPSGPSKKGSDSPPPHRDLSYGMLPKAPVPPSGPSKKGSDSPPPHRDLSYGMLPKGPVPPSGPGKKGSDSPPPRRDLSYGMLPKGPIPPSGPREKSSDSSLSPSSFVPGDVKRPLWELVPPSAANAFYFYSPPLRHVVP